MVFDTGTGRLLITPGNDAVTALWASRGYLPRVGDLPEAKLPMRVLEHPVANAAGPDWDGAVAGAAELLTGMGAEERRWEVTAAVALMVDATACGRGINLAQVQREDIAEPLAAVLAAVTPPPDQAQ